MRLNARIAQLGAIRELAFAEADVFRTGSVSFPLTPALSLGEREKRRQSVSKSGTVGSSKERALLFPRERVRVRGNGEPTARRTGRFLELSNSVSPPVEPEVCSDDL